MNFSYPLLGAGWCFAAWLLWLPLFVLAVWRAPWKSLVGDASGNASDAARLNVWMGMIVALVLFWSMKAGVKPGLDLHLTGVMLFTLVFEAPLAFVGLNLVLLGVTLNGALAWSGFALNALMTAGVGVAIAHLIHRGVDAFCPRHFFIFIFFKGFFGSALAIIGIGLCACLLYGVTGVYAWRYLGGEYLPYYLLLGFSEAWLSGALLTLMAVYYPGWVATYDQHIYLDGK
jgi:uncharacterized membrane protein